MAGTCYNKKERLPVLLRRALLAFKKDVVNSQKARRGLTR